MKRLLKLAFGSAYRRIFGNEKKVVAADAQAHGKPPENATESEAPQVLTIWTVAHQRYAVAAALCTDVEVYPSTAVALGEDISAYVIDTPSGESVVVEARTGSLVGHSLEVVRDGVREMTKLQVNNQLDTARKEFNRLTRQAMSNDEFWRAIRMGNNEVEISQDYPE